MLSLTPLDAAISLLFTPRHADDFRCRHAMPCHAAAAIFADADADIFAAAIAAAMMLPPLR